MRGHRPDNALRACDGITLNARACKRRASVEYHLRDGSVVGYCAQHDSGSGIMRALRPYPWEIMADNDARALDDGPFSAEGFDPKKA